MHIKDVYRQHGSGCSQHVPENCSQDFLLSTNTKDLPGNLTQVIPQLQTSVKILIH